MALFGSAFLLLASLLNFPLCGLECVGVAIPVIWNPKSESKHGHAFQIKKKWGNISINLGPQEGVR